MYNIETLARLTGLTRRTIRYYVQRGVLDPPQGGGRGSYYTEGHLAQLKKVRNWSEQGVPLIYMKDMLAGKAPPAEVDTDAGVVTVAYQRCLLAEGVELLFRPGRLSNRDILRVQELIQDLLEEDE